MTRARLQASLALWRRRHAWRQRRLDAAHKANDPKRVAHWHKLLTQAGTQIRHRENQLHPKPPAPFKPLEGVDWAWGTVNVAELKRAGIHFACRYLSHDATKNLRHAEAVRLSKAGINLVVVWETTANRALSNHAAGAKDAQEAEKQARACGMPAGKPIYFAVDFDGTVHQVREYFKGVGSVLGKDRVGAYGSYEMVKGLFALNLITYGWQTYAWSGGQWDPKAQIQQYENGVKIAGVSADRDRAMHPNYGQWRTS